MNLYAFFYQRFSSALQKTVIQAGERYLNYQHLDDTTALFAARLQALGLKSGDRLVAQVAKSAETVFLYLACLRTGVIYVPLNMAYQQDELDYFFKDARPTLILCHPDQEKNIKKLGNYQVRSFHVDNLSGETSGQFFDNMVTLAVQREVYMSDPDDIAVILYTSGTTGQPKGAMLSHRALVQNCIDLNLCWGFTDSDVLLHTLPLFHVHGLFFALHSVLYASASMILQAKFDPMEVIISLIQATVFMGVPTYYTRLLKEAEFTGSRAAQVRLFISGSAPLHEKTFQGFYQRTGKMLIERYGMSETGINTSNPLHGERKFGTVGMALEHVTVRVVDEVSGKVLIPGQNGEVQVQGRHLFSGYWQKEDQTDGAFTHDQFFKTGDLGYLDEQGYLTLVGRVKDMIISGGLNIYPKEIETVIDRVTGVNESAVVGVAHEDFGEGVVAVVVLQDNANILAEHIIAYCKASLADFKCPKKVVFIDQLPRNTMGKVQKNQLRQQYQAIFADAH
ncbi:Long-chain-fatty-acid--CoA ligase [Piscirickettsia salmonis]|uniref:AMP-binding protein n=1 Tax=Piscirickettsia salmonis TaxID=1238 RepID=UPI0012BAA5A7|nr:AMP-binding protein [Piscirickettsia salmonis]QGP52766.1 Long-chain-fatty-acid--CoA ligase [Piscirickettsia salmonis]QGP57629.1 Long-chain-fatty-acid--CoA ligase [Piscirickettsia salmonis]QGP62334.1 Long-chain-fatty-acid--CoA ligase [Piscirickettsia salmonis]